MSTPQELVACIEKLASLPAVYHRIRDVLDHPDSSVLELAEAVSSDTAITARVLRVVNSVLYGFPGKVETVPRAVNLMGMQQVHDLVLSTLVVAAFNGIRPARMHMARFWNDSVFRGLVARAAARRLGTGDPERIFVQGLLADIGHLVMFQVAPEPSAAALESAARDVAGAAGRARGARPQGLLFRRRRTPRHLFHRLLRGRPLSVLRVRSPWDGASRAPLRVLLAGLLASDALLTAWLLDGLRPSERSHPQAPAWLLARLAGNRAMLLACVLVTWLAAARFARRAGAAGRGCSPCSGWASWSKRTLSSWRDLGGSCSSGALAPPACLSGSCSRTGKGSRSTIRGTSVPSKPSPSRARSASSRPVTSERSSASWRPRAGGGPATPRSDRRSPRSTCGAAPPPSTRSSRPTSLRRCSGWDRRRQASCSALPASSSKPARPTHSSCISPARWVSSSASLACRAGFSACRSPAARRSSPTSSPTSIDIIVRGVKSGLPLNQCLRIIAAESPEPLRAEFQALVDSSAMGVPLDQSMQRMYDRMPLPEVNFFSIVLVIQQKTGGNLSESLGNLSSVLRARKLMKEKVKALSSEAKASAMIIGSLPIVVMCMVYFTRPTYILILFNEPVGNLILLGAACMMSMGIFVMNKMVNFKF